MFTYCALKENEYDACERMMLAHYRAAWRG